MPTRNVVLSCLACGLAASACGSAAKPAAKSQDQATERAAEPDVAVVEPTTVPEPGPSPLAAVAPTKDGWYDATPLLVSLRPSERVDAAKRAGLDSLASVPLYDLKVSVDPRAGTFDVAQEAYVTNRYGETLPELVFRLHGNPQVAGSSAPTRVRLVRGTCEGRACEVKQGPASVVRVRFADPLPAGGRVRVQLELSGVLERVEPASTGLFAQTLAGLVTMKEGPKDTTYGLMSACDGFASMAGFFAVLGRREAGAWAAPDDGAVGDFGSDEIAHVRAQIDVPPVARVATPGIAVRNVLVPGPEGDGPRRRFDVAAAIVRDFSLFVGDKADVVERRVGDVTVRSFFLEGNRAIGERVADITDQSLAVFERRFGPYPYTELDVVEAPLSGGAGGVEFSGLIAVASMLYRPFPKDDPFAAFFAAFGGGLSEGPAAAMLDETLEFTTVHEVSHQWWHGLVGSDSRTHPFVDESLAQYSTIVYFEDRYGAQRAERAAQNQVRMNYLGMRLMGHPDGPADRPAAAFDPVAYAGLVYGKAPFFYREARKVMGDAAFFAALRAYADGNRFRTAPARGPVPVLASGTHAKRVQALAKRWLEQTHGDQDLGPIDMKSMIGAMLGPDAEAIAPQAEEILKLLGPSSPGGSSPGGQVPADPTKVMKQLERMLDSF